MALASSFVLLRANIYVQMPIVDGLTSTKMIRSMEQSHDHKGHSRLAANNNHRIPIFAVSASLMEEKRQNYMDAGFDGWILKPIDFKRLSTLLSGIYDLDLRKTCLYVPGEWERGGWLSLGGNSSSESAASSQATPTGEDSS